jgi:membrane-associated phospholipid phosphatase
MPPRPRRAAITPLAALAVGAGIATVLLHAAAVGTSAGQRLDDAGRRIPPSGDLSPADAATRRLLETVSVSSLALLGVAIMLVAVLRDRAWLAAGAGAAVLGANLTTQAIKSGVDRPDLVDGTGVGPGAFPSGHVTVAASLALALVLVAPPALRWTAALAGGAYAAGIAVAVLALGWHRPSEVLAAYLVATAWAALAAAALVAVRGPGELGASAGRAGRAGAAVAAALAVAFAIVVAVAAERRLDLPRAVEDRTALTAAVAVSVAAGSALVAIVTSMLQGLRASRARRRGG